MSRRKIEKIVDQEGNEIPEKYLTIMSKGKMVPNRPLRKTKEGVIIGTTKPAPQKPMNHKDLIEHISNKKEEDQYMVMLAEVNKEDGNLDFFLATNNYPIKEMGMSGESLIRLVRRKTQEEQDKLRPEKPSASFKLSQEDQSLKDQLE